MIRDCEVVLQEWVSAEEANALLERREYDYLSPAELEFHRPGNNYVKSLTPEALAACAAGAPARKRVTKARHDGGARILLGTDCLNPLLVPGFSLHEELSNLVDAGLTPYEAIRAGTSDAAEFLDAANEFGTVAVGCRADLILVEANPLDDVGNANKLLGVMLRGEWYPRAELQARLDALAETYARATAKVIAPPPPSPASTAQLRSVASTAPCPRRTACSEPR